MTAAFLDERYDSRIDAPANVRKIRAIEQTFAKQWKNGTVGEYVLEIVIADGVVQSHSQSHPHGAYGIVSGLSLVDFATLWAETLVVGWYGELIVSWEVRDGQHERVTTRVKEKFK